MDHPNLPELNLIPAARIWNDLEAIPERAGIYLFFFKGGANLLEATSYPASALTPFATRAGLTHMYTGAAIDLRRRMKQHLHRDYRGSSLRKTLIAVEYARKALSGSDRRSGKPISEKRLSVWLRENAYISIQPTDSPFEREREVLSSSASPLNITMRRNTEYSRALMQWRVEAFPDGGHPVRLS
jgi:predicted GIY-YIG superfamily endonuclease